MSARVLPAQVRIKRAYEPASAQDGTRILIDRLWPRGVKKEPLALALWSRELAPSSELRRWFGHDPTRWQEFRQRYAAELRPHAALLESLRALARQGTLTLVYGARDEVHNDAVALRDFLLAPPADDTDAGV